MEQLQEYDPDNNIKIIILSCHHLSVTWGVDTDIVTAAVVLRTFIDVLTGETAVRLAVSQVTDTLVGPHHVLTGPITANSAEK